MKTGTKSQVFKCGSSLVTAISILCLTGYPANSRAQRNTGQNDNDEPQWATPAVQAPRLQYRTFDSASAGSKVSYHIYTPEIYDAETEHRFPVLYWLHGSGGKTAGIRPLVNYFDTAIRAGKIPPMLIVFPNGLPNGMWCDSKDGRTPVETMLIQELIPEIDSSFRTVASREGRIIEGFSMGGYGAGRLGPKYHNLFCAVSMLAAGPLHPEFETRRVGPPGRNKLLNEVYGGDMEYFRAMSPWRLAEQNAGAVRNGMFFRVVIGDQDNTLDFSRGFSEHMTQLNIPHTFMVLPGIDHNPMKTLNALGEDNWAFYRQAFGPLLTESLKKEIP